jgi:membrane protein implicated in regulation of membrane protease activity
MEKIWSYIRENKEVLFIVLGQVFLVILALSAVYYAVSYIASLPGFQFDPFLMILIVLLGWQFWRILDKQNRIIEKQNDLIEDLAKRQENLALPFTPEEKKRKKK